jgi:hypothetical protein
VLIEKLPSGVFADPFELQHFVERKGETELWAGQLTISALISVMFISFFILQFFLMLLFLETQTLNYPRLCPTGQLLRFILISSQAQQWAGTL